MSVVKQFQIKLWHISILLFLLLGYLYYINVPPKSNEQELLYWGYFHVILHSLSIALYFRRNHQKTSYPFIVLFSFFSLIAFGLPVFFVNKHRFLFSQLTVPSLEYSFYAYFLIYGTYWIFSPVLFKNLRPFQPIQQISLKKLRIILFIFLLLILIDYLKLIPAIAQLVGIFKNVYIGLSLMLILRRQSNIWEKISFSMIFIYEMLSHAVSGLIAELALILLFILVVMYICSVRFTYILPLIIPFMLFYGAFSKVKFAYRQKVWFSKKIYSMNDKLTILYDLTQRNNKTTKKTDKEGGDNFFLRYSYPSSIFSLTLKKTPSIVPFWNGITYTAFFTKFIPRILWPDKPVENLGHVFGVKYGILRQSDKITSINTPIIVEMYINFGLAGIYIGSVLFGLVLIFIERYFNSNMISIENKIVNASVTFSLLIIEVNFSLLFGNLFLFCIVMYFVFRYIKD